MTKDRPGATHDRIPRSTAPVVLRGGGAGILLAIGTAAGAASFTHVHDVAAAHGQDGWFAWADAVVLELMSVAAGLDIRRRKKLGASLTFPVAVLTVAVFLSLAAQVEEAEA